MVRVSRRGSDLDETLTAQPCYELVDVLRIPEAQVGPVRAIGRRIAIALLALVVAVITVYLGRDGYTDVRGVPLSVVDCVYFATISLTTVGYGTKGKTAVRAIFDDDEATKSAKDLVVVDTEPSALEHAAAAGLVTVHGDATRADVLRPASAKHASAIIVATGRDDTATLVTLTAREVAPKATIVASIREAENQHLLKQSGADSVVVSSETAGRLLGVVRDGHLLRVDAPEVDNIEAADRLLYVRNTGN